MKTRKCLGCGIEISTRGFTKMCRTCWQLGGKKKGGWNHTVEAKNKCREAKIGEKNPMWRGDKIGYTALHHWIRYRMPKPKFCVRCKKRKAYDLANKGIYDRNLKNWEWICRRCHMIEDGRMKNLISYQGE